MAADWPLPEGLRSKGDGGLEKDDDERQKLNVYECRCRSVADRGWLCGSMNDNPGAQPSGGGPVCWMSTWGRSVSVRVHGRQIRPPTEGGGPVRWLAL